jgi:hypothetical protein
VPQVAFALPGSAALVLSAEAGLMLPWGANRWSKPTAISDRFFMGGIGAGALRGFVQKGVGPTDLRRPAPREEVRALCALGWVARRGALAAGVAG